MFLITFILKYELKSLFFLFFSKEQVQKEEDNSRAKGKEV